MVIIIDCDILSMNLINGRRVRGEERERERGVNVKLMLDFNKGVVMKTIQQRRAEQKRSGEAK